MTLLSDDELLSHFYEEGTIGLTSHDIKRVHKISSEKSDASILAHVYRESPKWHGSDGEIRRVPIRDIHVPTSRRPLNCERVSDLVQSIKRLGLMTPPQVMFRDGIIIDGEEMASTPVLITGHHRLAAMKELGHTLVLCLVRNIDEVDAELVEISENLHRAELTVLQRDEQITRWIQLTTVRNEAAKDVSVQLAPKVGRPESGINAAARELGIESTDAKRAVKVASLPEEAKQAALTAGLDNNRTALLAATKAPTPAAQIAVLNEWNTAREVASVKAKFEREQKRTANTEAIEMAIMNFYTAWSEIPPARKREVLMEINASAYLEGEQ